jgi:hypothetical protein
MLKAADIPNLAIRIRRPYKRIESVGNVIKMRIETPPTAAIECAAIKAFFAPYH